MKTLLLNVLAAASLLLPGARLYALDSTYNEKGVELVFANDDPGLDARLKERMAQTFFAVYPQMADAFNKEAPRKVRFAVETHYNGVAATSGDTIHFSANYLRQHPLDIDVITHEAMHVVQQYRRNAPGWLTEGIADYARYKYGVDNAGGGWSLPDYQASQHYDNSYRITARFLAWLEKNGQPGIVAKLDQVLRAGTYTPDTWTQLTGKSVETLWQDYGSHPTL